MITASAHQPKTAAIYDRWFHTLGGGEQLAFAYAKLLKKLGYEVTLLTHTHLNTVQAEQKMNVQLSDFTIRYLPQLPDYALGRFTAGYDLFICNSYLDYIPNQSKVGILSVFFPSKLHLSVFEYAKRQWIVPLLRWFFYYPAHFEGFEYDSYENGRVVKWLGTESTITFNQPVQNISLLFTGASDESPLSFLADDEPLIPTRITSAKDGTTKIVYSFHSVSKPFVRLTILTPTSSESIKSKIGLVDVQIAYWRNQLYRLFKQYFPVLEMRLHGGATVTSMATLQSYHKIVAISHFTARWIQSFWQLPATVIYPPVAIEAFKPAAQKEKMIVHIGRFFVGGHSKKQLELLRVFKQLYDAEHTDWQLHFIGGVAQSSVHQEYLEVVRREAAGYPIFIHTDAPFAKLKQLLETASIYWHATGLDEDDQKDPGMLEHFGITTVEAMAAGCVPIVINKGGQPEIVSAESGFLWNTREELYAATEAVMNDEKVRSTMSQQAEARSESFSAAAFEQQFTQLLQDATKKE